MTSHTITGATASTDRDNARRALVPLAVGSFVVAALLSATNADSTREWMVEIPVQLVAAGLLFGLVVPRGLRHESAGGRGIAMGVIALLLVMPAFWTGLPLQLGVAAALLGFAGKRASHGSGKATASLVLGTLAVVAYLAVYVLDYLHTHGVG
jgi:peptidoglycan/LPS O-acetylase OafA/YrhL